MNLDTIRVVTASPAPPDAFDLVFVATAVTFNLLMAALLVAAKRGHFKVVRALGTTWLALAVPLGVVLVHYLLTGTDAKTLLCFAGVFLYMAVESLLDYVLKIDFRTRWVTHAPYILLEYVALLCLIAIAFSIGQAWGYAVAICFWVVMASVVYTYAGKKGALT